ncbi:Gfo/Idh/MocA family protein [Shewanella khirikhana]|uniref:Oxidoreductase n=1 Tax=Shewanella khirikhana TaxID=1965282 RepID=A0ABM7DBT4_9GAMM|nr:Gfo/Idh/MocA family oxidoreductase [Shewanella khirikhana]AZQ11110.1 putative oxidoreductase [Shewanella khirikhana]
MDYYAVVGMGSIAKRHIKNLKFLYPNAQIYVASSSGKNFDLPEGASAVVSLSEIIALKPNYVVLASPASYHVETAKLLLENKIPVLIEKPLTAKFSDAAEFLNFYESKKYPPVAVGYCLRFLPSALAVKSFLESGGLGTVYNVHSVVGQFLPSWRSDKSYKDSVSAKAELGGGALLELSHELDYLQWIFGPLVLQHSWLRTTEELGLQVEEIANLIITTETGVYISVHLDFVQKATQRKCEFIGEKGNLYWDLVANTVTFKDSNSTSMIYADEQYDKNTMYLDMLKAFADVENLGRRELASVRTSAKVIELIQLAKQSNKGNVLS